MTQPSAKSFRVNRRVPPPVRVRNTYPWRTMKVGESFTIPPERVPRGPFNGNAQRYGIRITIKKQADGSLRVWRIQ